MRPIFASFALLLVAGCPAGNSGQPAEPEPPVEPSAAADATGAEAPELPPERARDLESFDQVWKTVRDKHFDPELGGLDWDAVRDELRPRVAAAGDREEARAVMREMLARLGQSHFQIIPGSTYQVLEGDTPDGDAEDATSKDDEPEGGSGTVGIDARVDDDTTVLVTAVDRESPAAAAGIEPGWSIRRIGDADLAEVLSDAADKLVDSPMRATMLAAAVHRHLDGAVGSEVEVTLVDGDDEEITVALLREAPRGKVARLGNLPPITLDYRQRRIGKDVGYIAFDAFLDPARIMQKYTAAIEAYRDTRGIIIDLRGNPGGLGAMAMGMGGWLVDEQASLGTMITRDTEIDFVLNPQADPYRGEVAILIDELSMSTSEIFAAGLQDIDRARVFGRRSPGAALPSVVERLPNGDGFQYAFANYVSSGGDTLEGKGVVPDHVVPLARDRLLSDGDPAIQAAIDWIRGESKSN